MVHSNTALSSATARHMGCSRPLVCLVCYTTQEPVHRPAIYPPSRPHYHPCLTKEMSWSSVDPPAHLPHSLTPPIGSRDPAGQRGDRRPMRRHHTMSIHRHLETPVRAGFFFSGFEPVTHWHHAAAARRADTDEARTIPHSPVFKCHDSFLSFSPCHSILNHPATRWVNG